MSRKPKPHRRGAEILACGRRVLAPSRRFFAGLLLALAPIDASMAGEVALAWDPVADARVAGYQVHYGTNPRTYSQRFDTTASSAMIGGLQGGATYYFAVRACASDGVTCSVFSNQVCALVSPLPDSRGQACELALPSRGGWRVILGR